MSGADSNLFVDWYTKRIGTPATADEAYGYWVFVLGLVFGVAGISAIMAGPEAGSTIRGVGIGLAAIGLLLMLIGPIIRLPLRRVATGIAYVGGLVGLVAVAWFAIEYNAGNWSVDFENNEVYVIGFYGAGILIMAVGSVMTPLVTRSREQVQATEANRSESGQDAVSSLEEAQRRVEAAERRAQEAERKATEATERAQESVEGQTRRQVIETELQQIETSQSQFELYTDAGGDYRWRLRHRNRNVIADSAEGYASRQKARQGLAAVKRDAFGATVIDLDLLDEPLAAASTDDDAAKAGRGKAGREEAPQEAGFVRALPSRGRFETYADSGGDHRWALRHENGNLLADSGQGYSSAGARDDAVEYVRQYVQVADYLPVDPAAVEVGRDRDGSYYWRLLHRNGSVLAEAGRRYDTRRAARDGVAALRRHGEGDTEVQVFQNNPNEWRWRLVDADGLAVAKSGEWYVSKENATASFERAQAQADEADVLDVGSAAVEIYEDRGEEWRWRLRHRNGRIMADSGEGYATRDGAERGVTSVKRNVPNAPVVERESGN